MFDFTEIQELIRLSQNSLEQLDTHIMTIKYQLYAIKNIFDDLQEFTTTTPVNKPVSKPVKSN